MASNLFENPLHLTLGDSAAGCVRALSDAERSVLAQDFARIRDETSLLRRWQGGQIIGIPMDYYDSLLLEACSSEWTLAAHVIGIAMGR